MRPIIDVYLSHFTVKYSSSYQGLRAVAWMKAMNRVALISGSGKLYMVYAINDSAVSSIVVMK